MHTLRFGIHATNRPRAARRLARPGVEALEVRNLLSGATTAPTAAPVSAAAAPGDWTVMVYITATDLASNGPGNIQEMERLATRLPPSVKIVVMYDQFTNRNVLGQPDPTFKGIPYFATGNGTQRAWSTAGIGVIQADAHLAELDALDNQIKAITPRIVTPFAISPTEVNTGNPATLTNFIVDAAQIAPAYHYALILWDHGGGVQAFNNDTYDVLPNDRLTTTELVSTLTASRARGVSLDLLAYDECLMATLEGSYLLGDLAPITVASEELVDGPGMNYNTALAALANNPAGGDARTLAVSIVDGFDGRYGGQGEDSDTMSAVTASGSRRVAAALANFVTATRLARPVDWPTIAAARVQSPVFGQGENLYYRDLGTFMSNVAASTTNPALEVAASAVAAAVNAAVFANTANSRQARGISIYFPHDKPKDYTDYLDEAGGFLGDTGWASFLDRFWAATAGRPVPRAGWAFNHDGAASALDLGVQVGVTPAVPGLVLPAGGQDWYRFTTVATASAGSRVRVEVGAGGPLRLVVYAADGSSIPIRRGQGSVRLGGLPAGTYLVAASRVRPGAAVPYSLKVDAPRARVAVPANNRTAATAEDLGLVAAPRLVAGLRRSSGDQPAWFTFDTARWVQPTRGSVTILSPGVPLIATLYDEDGVIVKTARGRRALRIDYRESGSAESYQLAVRGRPGSYSIFFADPTARA